MNTSTCGFSSIVALASNDANLEHYFSPTGWFVNEMDQAMVARHGNKLEILNDLSSILEAGTHPNVSREFKLLYLQYLGDALNGISVASGLTAAENASEKADMATPIGLVAMARFEAAMTSLVNSNTIWSVC